MGAYKNGRLYNIIAWATVVLLICLTGAMVVTSFVPSQ